MTISFGQNLKYLRKSKGLILKEMPANTGFSSSQWNNWELGNAFPSFLDLLEISKYFGIKETELIHSDLTIGNLNPVDNKNKNEQKGNLIGNPIGNLNAQKLPITGYLQVGNFTATPLIVTVDSQGNENIIHVPVRARAGYLSGYGDQEYINSLTTYSLPGLRGKTYRSFEIEGTSMKPTLLPRDWVVGEWVERLDDIRENRVLIIVTHNDGILIKRVLNRISERGKLYLKSDTIANRADYPTLELDPADIAEIWYARMRFGTDFSEPSELFKRLDDLEIEMMEVRKRLLNIS